MILTMGPGCSVPRQSLPVHYFPARVAIILQQSTVRVIIRISSAATARRTTATTNTFSDSSGSTADDDSGGGGDDDEVVIICILGMSGFATADLDDAAVTVVATSVAAVLDGVTAQDIYDIAAADARRRRRRLLDITITFEIRLSLADTQFASADDLGASVDSQLNEAVADGSLTSTVQAEAESAASRSTLAAASADSVDTEVAPRDKSPAGGGGGKNRTARCG